jgi:uncharacterized protein
MSRIAAGAAWSALVLASLTGCGTSPYCQAVEDHQVALNSLGEERTTAAYTQYEQAFRAVANVAPAGIRKDWTKLSDVIDGVLAAHRSAGIRLEDMSSTNKQLAALPEDKLKALNAAYEAFNNTDDERKAVVKNVKDECQITLT